MAQLENVKKECIVRYSVVKMCVRERRLWPRESVEKRGKARAVDMTKQSSEILQQALSTTTQVMKLTMVVPGLGTSLIMVNRAANLVIQVPTLLFQTDLTERRRRMVRDKLTPMKQTFSSTAPSVV